MVWLNDLHPRFIVDMDGSAKNKHVLVAIIHLLHLQNTTEINTVICDGSERLVSAEEDGQERESNRLDYWTYISVLCFSALRHTMLFKNSTSTHD